MVISGNQKLLKNLNRLAVLRRLRIQPGSSRVELAVALGLTKTTIGQLVDGLLAEGWVVEERSRVTGELGRRRTPLYLDRNRYTLIGVDMNPDRVIVLGTGLSGELRELSLVLTPSREADTVLDTLVTQLVAIHQKTVAGGGQVCGLGVGVPGVVDTETGMLHMSERAGWRKLPVRAMLLERLARHGLSELPALVERAVGCTALYHFEFERTAEEDPLMYVQVGAEIALAVASRYSLLRGRSGMAGSIGHLCFDPSGPRCSCGRYGCLNVMVTVQAIERETGKSPGEVRALAAAGNPQIIEVLRETGSRLGVVLYNQCLIQNPARLFVGGPAFQLGRAYLQAAQRTLDEMLGNLGRKAPRISVMRYDAHDVALGAATRVMHSLISLVD